MPPRDTEPADTRATRDAEPSRGHADAVGAPVPLATPTRRAPGSPDDAHGSASDAVPDVTRVSLVGECARCTGLCCVALPFHRGPEFPVAKDADTPCRNLRPDHGCAIHPSLRRDGWVGCTVYDCYGAGQRITALTTLTAPGTADQPTARATGNAPEHRPDVLAAFRATHQLHEMLWYLTDPACARSRHADAARQAATDITTTIDDAARTGLPTLAATDVTATRTRVAMILRAVSDDTRGRAQHDAHAATRLPRAARPGGDLAGARLRRADLRSAPLRGALLIGADLRDTRLTGADLLGTDLRDADLRGADLTDALFLTRPQVAAAHGDTTTRLPGRLTRPSHWT